MIGSKRSMKGHGRTGHIMVMELTLLEKGNGKETSILENSRMEKRMDKEHTLFLMEESMLGNSRMGNNMVKEYSLHLLETSMLENSRTGNNMVKGH